MSRRPIRWRIAEAFEGRWGWVIITAIAAFLLAVVIVPLVFRPFVGRPEVKETQQTEVRCLDSYSEIQKGMPFDAEDDDPRRVCVERARARAVVAGVTSFFILLFAALALLARAGKIQPKEPAR